MKLLTHPLKTAIFLFFISSLLIGFDSFATTVKNPDKIGELVVASGLVKIASLPNAQPQRAKRRTPITLNSAVLTASGRSKTKIRLLDGTFVQLRNNSKVSFDQFVFNPALKANGTIEMTLVYGNLRSAVGNQKNKGRTLLKSHLGSVSVDKGDVEIAVDGSKFYVAVWAGEASVTNSNADKSEIVGPKTKHSFAIVKKSGQIMLLPQPPAIFLQ